MFTLLQQLPDKGQKEPSNKKKGIAISGKESIPPNINVGRILNGIASVTTINAIAARPRQKATGTPISIVTTNTIDRVSIIYSLLLPAGLFPANVCLMIGSRKMIIRMDPTGIAR